MQKDIQKPDVPKWKYNLIGIVVITGILVFFGWIIYFLFDWLVDLSDFFNG